MTKKFDITSGSWMGGDNSNDKSNSYHVGGGGTVFNINSGSWEYTELVLDSMRGPQGEVGKSAYEVAVDNGFEGNVIEWLDSLRAPEGTDLRIYVTKEELDVILDEFDSSRITHISNKENPHNVTKDQVGLGNVDNTSDKDKPISDLTQIALNAKVDQSKVLTDVPEDAKFTDTIYIHPETHPADMIEQSINRRFVSDSEKALWNSKTDDTVVDEHKNDESNPHNVTKTQVGLSNVTNVAQASKAEFDLHESDDDRHINEDERDKWNSKQDKLDFTPEDTVNKGKAGGYASLDADAKVPASQLPSYVDDVIEGESLDDLPEIGESGKIYVALDTNRTYRWSGTKYVEISASLALGTTDSTAYSGRLGHEAYMHSQVKTGNPHDVTKSDVGLENVDDTRDLDKPISTKTQTALDTKVDNHRVLTDVPANAKFTDTVYTHPTSHSADMITESTSKQFVTATDKSNWNSKTDDTVVNEHKNDESNPHKVTKAQVGLSNVTNVAQASKEEFDLHTSDSGSHITVEERLAWDGKQEKLTSGDNITFAGNTISAEDTTYNEVTSSNSGLMSSDDKSKLDDIEDGANKYIHPETHPYSMITDTPISLPADGGNADTVNEHTVESNVPADAKFTDTVYIHPSTHPASMITESATKSFVSETEKALWNSKTDDTALNTHKNDKTNPHGVTKTQVGLGLVNNYDVSSKAEAEEGTSNTKYMTPLRTKEAVDSIINPHTSDDEIHITEEERYTWNFKQDRLSAGSNIEIDNNTISSIDTTYDVAETDSDGLMSSTDKSKLDNIEDGANKYIHPSTHPYSMITDTPTSLPADGGNADTVNNHTVESNVPANAKFTDTLYSGVDINIDGLMLSTDKVKLDNIEDGANKYIHPSFHSVDMIIETNDKKFVSSVEKDLWNSKIDDTIVIEHKDDKSNPHNVTKTQIGLGSVNNYGIATDNEAREGLVNNKYMTPLRTKESINNSLDPHISDTHVHVTDSERASWNAKQNNLGFTPENISNKGKAGGYASLDADAKVPASQLPSYVDSVTEWPTVNDLPEIGESGKIYVALDTNGTYRWSGSQYIEISSSLSLGTTSSTAYRGDFGQLAYEHSQIDSGNPHNITKSNIGLSNVNNTSDEDKPISNATKSALNNKADKSQVLTDVPANAKFTDTIYIHPANHPSSMITESSDKRFVSDSEKALWNSKTDDTVVNDHINSTLNPHALTKAQIGLSNVQNYGISSKAEAEEGTLNTKYMTPLRTKESIDSNLDPHITNGDIHVTTEDKLIWSGKQNELNAGSNITISGNNISAIDTIYDLSTSTNDGLMSSADKAKMDDIDENANNYIHPATHPYSMLTGTPDRLPADGGNSNTVNNHTVNSDVPVNAKFTDTIYIHPESHPAEMIVEDEDRNFVSEFEKTLWNSKTDDTALNTHKNDKINPHAVTKAQVGLSNVTNVAQASKTEFDTHNTDSISHITSSERTIWNAKQDALTAGANITISNGTISSKDTIYNDSEVQTHMDNKTNPHAVTKAQVGLSNVTNVSQASKTEFDTHNTDSIRHITSAERSTWNAKQNNLGFTPENISNKGKAGGYASLDADAKVPASQLPSYVDDVIEENSLGDLPASGEAGKIYVTLDDNKTYRWSGTKYVEISSSLALGTTSSTAYQGDLGHEAYVHSQVKSGNPHNVTKENVELGNVDNTSDANKPISTATQTALNTKVNNARVLTDVPANAKFTDTIYTHPNSHPASMTIESTTRRFLTDIERLSWNSKTDDTTVNTHMDDSSNPHNVTKTQVGLSNVQNYGVATQAQAQAGNANNLYMTPLRTKEAITEFETTYGLATGEQNGLMSNIDKSKLDNLDNTKDIDKPISTATQTELDTKASINYVDDSINNMSYGDRYKWVYNEDHDSLDLVVME